MSLKLSQCPMAETSHGSDVVANEISSLKEALRAQHQLIQKLYLELDEERDSTATAASEALAMILRLQGERAAERMEANQYKRVAEEKLYHVEDSLIMFEELINQKDMEIASLELQLQAYHHRLLSIGFQDLHAGEMNVMKSPSLYRSGAQFDDTSVLGIARRASLPVMRFKCSRTETGNSLRKLEEKHPDHDIDFYGGNGSRYHEKILTLPEESTITKDFNSCWEQIHQVDKCVKELSHAKRHEHISGWISANKKLCENIAAYSASLKAGCGPCTDYRFENEPTPLPGSSQSAELESVSEIDVYTSPDNGLTTHSSSIHDVFEVPQNQKPTAEKMAVENENKLKTLNPVPPNATVYCCKESQLAKREAYAQHKSNVSTHIDIGVNCDRDVVDPNSGPPLLQLDILEIKRRLQKLEDKRRILKQEESDRRTEELKLLREIREQLQFIQPPKIENAEKRCRPDWNLDYFIEAMLSFSI